MPDQATFTLRLGNWQDEAFNYEPPDVAHVQFNGNDDVARHDLIQSVNEWGMTSWAYKYEYDLYFANASSDGIAILITAYPVIAEALWSGSLEVIARFLTSKLLAVFKSDGNWTIDNADEMATRMLIYNVGLARPDITQRLATQDEDGTWLFIYHDKRRKADHIVRVSKQGVTAHVDTKHLEDVLERVRTFDYSQPPPETPSAEGPP